ncbi:DNA polymerase subunit Cdc27 [Macrophomina phaseolina]|uniref:DNA polymerase delta subunit 3 n=1 Tax=Macrophomina phaseolina TaxID=35725 RepID=A0ABQ8GSH7_9PEZI|nr:DNA polymerase subunit Cdc27 [Macrophomina phaseolina]
MDQYKEYLAANVLQENRPITYRLLSRELKVHVHQAKQMLYHFHATENEKNRGSVHATYVITGTKVPQSAPHANGARSHADTDVPMRSSPIPSSLPDAPAVEEERSPKVTLVKLVREEDLEGAKAEFEEVTSIHIYSLEPNSPKDLQILAECGRQIVERHSDENPLEAWKTYGSIHYPHAKRRTPGVKPQASASVATSAAAKTAPRPSTTAISKQKGTQDKGSEPLKTSQSSSPQVDTAALPSKKGDKLGLKRDTPSIFASFAKTQLPKKKATGSGISTPTAKSTEESQAEDEPMQDASEEEGDDDDCVIAGSNKSREEANEAVKKARAEREAREKKLRDMMEEDDDDTPMGDAPATAPEDSELPSADGAEEPESEPEKKEQVTVSNGRRRGRRRVMKKRTYQDAEGYFVTKEEAVWESFSEEEPQPKKPKSTPATTAKSKKGGGKQGQGSIMSFFAKKPS